MTIDTPNADGAMNPGGTQDEVKPHWWIDDNLPGIGNKPDWLNDKFKSVADMAKSYHELERRVGIAPDDYEFHRSKSLDPNYAPFVELQELAKSKRVPKDVMDKFIDSVDKYFDEFRTNEEEEFKKLGEKAEERIQILDNWAKANLTDESYSALTSKINDANSIKALEEIRSKMMNSGSNIPNANGQSGHEAPTVADLQAELNANLDKYKNDAKWRSDWQKRLEAASKTSNTPFVDKFM